MIPGEGDRFFLDANVLMEAKRQNYAPDSCPRPRNREPCALAKC